MPEHRQRPEMVDALNGTKYIITVDYRAKHKDAWSEAGLHRNLQNFVKITRPEMGKIYYQTESVHDPLDHFRSSLNSYFKLTDKQLQDLSSGH